MNNPDSKNILKTILFAGILVSFVQSCEKKDLIDPFWEINLGWDKETVTNMLYNNSRKGKIVNCVFSFEREFYVKNEDMDARVKASLDYPHFAQNDLKLIKYYLIAEFQNETNPKFNPVFFQYFKNKMISSYGIFSDENTNDETITLDWKVDNHKMIEATIIKDINHYIVSVIPR